MSDHVWIPIKYREFYDVPRMFVCNIKGRTLLFESSFDDDLDDYAKNYGVFQLPPGLTIAEKMDWSRLRTDGDKIGEVPVEAVRFDTTKREAIDIGSLPLRELEP